MPKKFAFEFMINFVRDYVIGKSSRLDFDLDFNYYLMQYYEKMERENCDLAEYFNFCLAEQGFDQAQKLSDAAHRKLITRQFKKFEEAMRDGLW